MRWCHARTHQLQRLLEIPKTNEPEPSQQLLKLTSNLVHGWADDGVPDSNRPQRCILLLLCPMSPIVRLESTQAIHQRLARCAEGQRLHKAKQAQSQKPETGIRPETQHPGHWTSTRCSTGSRDVNRIA